MNTHQKILTLATLLVFAGNACAVDMVVVGNPAAAPLTKDQVADIFLGKNASMTPVDQTESAAIRAEFYKRAVGRDMAQVKSVWSRLVFSGKAQLPRELPDSAAVKKAVAGDPKAVGYIEKSAVDGSVKVLLQVE